MLTRLGQWIRPAFYVTTGLCFLGLSLFFAVFLLQYLSGGAGRQIFPNLFSNSTILLGVAHVIGFIFAALFSFAVGVWLCAQGLVPQVKESKTSEGLEQARGWNSVDQAERGTADTLR